VLKHGFASDLDEGFTWKSRRCVPGGNYTKNPGRHNRI
jgi:hypothetical protein